jgi:hypothetical protein
LRAVYDLDVRRLPSVEEIRAAAVERAQLSTRWEREAEQAKREADALANARAVENFRLGREFLHRAQHFDLPETAYTLRVTAREPDGRCYDASLTLFRRDAVGASFEWALRERRHKHYSRPPNRYSEDPGESTWLTTYSEPMIYPASGLVPVEPDELARKMTSLLMTAANLKST